ncbi:nuclease-related domain-containing protein [Curtobacterium sp. MCBD17_032]|uniref:nuclease-related domain-containing protein n=1 Tax=Curtobacterium sp. MCBD17_032 TaxID=2175659 RepID=UPI001C654325|nr:nuclease-related domain-containing protein [Curtobacterium sp. MCBD17_032]
MGNEQVTARATAHSIATDAADTGALQQLTLRARRPGYAVMQECLREQSQAPPRSGWQRFWGRDPLRQEARSWFKGVLGERRVAAELARLGSAFTVLHAVPVGKGTTDIDHVVIGPTGVFTINTKNHSGQRVWVAGTTFMVAGRKTRNTHAARAEEERATLMLLAPRRNEQHGSSEPRPGSTSRCGPSSSSALRS